MDYSVFDELFQGLDGLQNWTSFFTEFLSFIPHIFVSMWGWFLIGIILIGVIIFVIKLIG